MLVVGFNKVVRRSKNQRKNRGLIDFVQRFLNFSLEVQPVEKFFENSDVHILTRNFVRMRLEQTAIFNFPETSGLSFFYFAFLPFCQ